jgi:putative transcriptional regulator
MKNEVASRRQQCGWSQEKLGSLAGVSRQTINAIEKGRYDPSLPLAFKLARIFGCSIEDLFDDGQRAAHAAVRLIGETHD